MHLWPVASLLSPSLTPVISHHPLTAVPSTTTIPSTAVPSSIIIIVAILSLCLSDFIQSSHSLPLKAVCTDPSIRTDTCLEEEVL